MKKSIKINATDFSDLFTPYGYTVQYKKVTGSNSGYMLNGDYTEDLRSMKAVITGICMPTTDEQLSNLLKQIYADTYCSVYFYDPKIQNYRTAIMIPSETTSTHRGNGSNGLDYWTGTKVTFTER